MCLRSLKTQVSTEVEKSLAPNDLFITLLQWRKRMGVGAGGGGIKDKENRRSLKGMSAPATASLKG